MIKAIFFDFDGVIVESAHIKTDAFREIFSKWPEYCEEAVKYHIINAGISRFVKFRYLYEELLKQPYTEDIEKEMGEEFSRIVFEQVMKAPLVDGTVEFFEDKDNVCQSFVVSATPQEELEQVVDHKKLNNYFKELFGSPSLKPESINTILNKYSFEKDETVFVGDGESDLVAANEVGVKFILRKTQENGYLKKNVSYEINDLTELKDLLLKI